MKRDDNKALQIEELKGKGSDWLAKALYEERRKRKEILEHCRIDRHSSHVEFDLSSINARAADVLRENGIQPVHLTVEYIAHKCQDCGIDECDYWTADVCEEIGKKHVSTLTFWAFDIVGDNMTGILQNFEEFDNKVISIRDRKGKVLWKIEEEQ